MRKHIAGLSSLFLLSFLAFGVLATPAHAEDKPKKNPLSDRQIVHHIHGAIVEDASLPYCAKVVKVGSTKGKVKLTGNVHTEEEKMAVEEKAADVAGDKNVTSEIKVKGS